MSLTNLFRQNKGLIAKCLGDAIRFLQCKKVDVELGTPKYCTHKLPVRYNGSDRYLLLGSGILTKKANHVNCGLVVKPIHKADGMWYMNDGKSLRPYSPPKMIPYKQKTPLSFMNLYMKNFDQNGLFLLKS